MTPETEKDTSRTVVKTYLPAYQREEWDRHADDLGMSRSEFVKDMVQAGRSELEAEPEPSPTEAAPGEASGTEGRRQSPRASPPLEETVLETLSPQDHLSWDELLEAVTEDVESRLEETLQELQSENRVRYSGRHGGYTLDS